MIPVHTYQVPGTPGTADRSANTYCRKREIRDFQVLDLRFIFVITAVQDTYIAVGTG